MTAKDRWDKWYAANRERFNAYQRAYSKRKRDEARGGPIVLLTPEELRRRKIERMAAWRSANPDLAVAGHAAVNANKRAARLGLRERLTAQNVLDLWKRQPKCVQCGQGRGIDHIENMRSGGANVPSNLQTLCISCNSRKENERRRHIAASAPK